MCHRFTVLNGEEADRVVDWLRAVRRALAGGMRTAVVAPPSFGRPGAVPFDAIDCFPGAESSVIVAEGSAAATQAARVTRAVQAMAPDVPTSMAAPGDLARIDLVWGIEVSWQKAPVFNARIESALSGSDMWRTAMEEGRCIVPVRAFYETRNVEALPEPTCAVGALAVSGGAVPNDPTELTCGIVPDVEQGVLGLEDARVATAPRPRGRRPQYRFAASDESALLLAGLRIGDRFALVTCEPDAVVGAVHTRMPLALAAPEALAWLDGRSDAASLLQRHLPVPLIAEEEPAPSKQPANPDQMSLF